MEVHDEDDDGIQLDPIEIPNFENYRPQITTMVFKNCSWIPLVKFIDFLRLNDMFDKKPNSCDHVWSNYATQIRGIGYMKDIDNVEGLSLT